MPYITFAAMFLVAASGILSLNRQLKVLQKNSYDLSLYFKWVRESYTLELAISALFYCAITVGIIKEKLILALVLAIVLTLLRILLSFSTRKQLAFTVRIKRLYIAAILILGILVLVSAICSNIILAGVCRTICLLLSIVTPVLTFITWGVTYPFEKVKKDSKNTAQPSDSSEDSID